MIDGIPITSEADKTFYKNYGESINYNPHRRMTIFFQVGNKSLHLTDTCSSP